MLLNRREVILDLPSAAVATSVAVPTAARPQLDETLAIERLGVAQSSITAAMRRLDRFIKKPSCYLYGGRAIEGGYAFSARLNGAERVSEGRWRLAGRASPDLPLDRAVAVVSTLSTIGWLDRDLRYLAGCAFGGLTLLVFGNARVKLGLVLPGHEFGTLTSHLEVRL